MADVYDRLLSADATRHTGPMSQFRKLHRRRRRCPPPTYHVNKNLLLPVCATAAHDLRRSRARSRPVVDRPVFRRRIRMADNDMARTSRFFFFQYSHICPAAAAAVSRVFHFI